MDCQIQKVYLTFSARCVVIEMTTFFNDKTVEIVSFSSIYTLKLEKLVEIYTPFCVGYQDLHLFLYRKADNGCISTLAHIANGNTKYNLITTQ